MSEWIEEESGLSENAQIALTVCGFMIFAVLLVAGVGIVTSKTGTDYIDMKTACWLAGDTSRRCQSKEYNFYGEYK